MIEQLADDANVAIVMKQGVDSAIIEADLINDVISASARFAMHVSAWMVHIGQNGGCSKINLVSRSVRCHANATDAANVGMSRGSTEQAVTVVPATASSLSCFKQAEKSLVEVGFSPF